MTILHNIYIKVKLVIKCASYINEKESYMWVRGFCLRGKKMKANARVLKDVTSFLSKALDLPIVLNSGV